MVKTRSIIPQTIDYSCAEWQRYVVRGNCYTYNDAHPTATSITISTQLLPVSRCLPNCYQYNCAPNCYPICLPPSPVEFSKFFGAFSCGYVYIQWTQLAQDVVYGGTEWSRCLREDIVGRQGEDRPRQQQRHNAAWLTYFMTYLHWARKVKCWNVAKL